jgi:hypothetical protein
MCVCCNCTFKSLVSVAKPSETFEIVDNQHCCASIVLMQKLVLGIISTYLQRLESDAAAAKPMEELQLQKGAAGVEVDTHNGRKFEEAEACTDNDESSSLLLWSGVDYQSIAF